MAYCPDSNCSYYLCTWSGNAPIICVPGVVLWIAVGVVVSEPPDDGKWVLLQYLFFL